MPKFVEVYWVPFDEEHRYLQQKHSIFYLITRNKKILYVDYVFEGFVFDALAQKKEELKLKGEYVVYYGAPKVWQLPHNGESESDFQDIKSILVHHFQPKYNKVEHEKALKATT
jgi:hypothetical protein